MIRLVMWGLSLWALLRTLVSVWINPLPRPTAFLIGASDWNQDVVANTQALKNPPSASYTLNEPSDYAGAGAWADVDATNLALTMTTTGGDVMVHFDGTFYMASGGGNLLLDVDVDGTRNAGDDGMGKQTLSTTPEWVSFTRVIEGLSAASHTFKLQWNTSTLARLAAGSGGTHDVHPQFWVREI